MKTWVGCFQNETTHDIFTQTEHGMETQTSKLFTKSIKFKFIPIPSSCNCISLITIVVFLASVFPIFLVFVLSQFLIGRRISV